jgi:hypothetical protein
MNREISPKQYDLWIERSKRFERAHRIVSNPAAHPKQDKSRAQTILDRGLSGAFVSRYPDEANSIYLGLFHYPDVVIEFIDEEDSDDPLLPYALN